MQDVKTVGDWRRNEVAQRRRPRAWPPRLFEFLFAVEAADERPGLFDGERGDVNHLVDAFERPSAAFPGPVGAVPALVAGLATAEARTLVERHSGLRALTAPVLAAAVGARRVPRPL